MSGATIGDLISRRRARRAQRRAGAAVLLAIVALLLPSGVGPSHAATRAVLVKDIYPGLRASDAVLMTSWGDTVVFSAVNETLGREPWRSDGTASGTAPIVDLNPGPADSVPEQFTVVNDLLFFVADDGVHGRELWVTDGIDTRLVKDINPGTQDGVFGSQTSPGSLTSFNGTLFFAADDGIHGMELWKSDGTAAGTVMVKDIAVVAHQRLGIRTPDAGSHPSHLSAVDGMLFFSANNNVHGRELWKSDGTDSGTVMVKDIRPFVFDPSSFPEELTDVNGTLFFTADDAFHGRELWKSDGTDAGTVMVKDIYRGWHSFPSQLTHFAGALFLVADDGVHGRELWKSDGTASGTVLFSDMNPGPDGSGPGILSGSADRLFFSAHDGGTVGTELWKTDGTSTELVKDINPGPLGSHPGVGGAATLRGNLYFSADDDQGQGRELWRSDGTAAGTTLLQDINPGEFGSSPRSFGIAGDNLFFVARDGVHGVELWRVEPNDPPDCSGVVASPAVIEPATADQMHLISLSGASDPDGDRLSYRIDGVSQDEPVTGQADPTTPDARFTSAGADSNQVLIRAERNAGGNGRVYRIAYMVSDGEDSCYGTAGVGGTTTAEVSVPRKKGQAAGDDGGAASWNSFTGAALTGTLP